jgi:hypothetical protein
LRRAVPERAERATEPEDVTFRRDIYFGELDVDKTTTEDDD